MREVRVGLGHPSAKCCGPPSVTTAEIASFVNTARPGAELPAFERSGGRPFAPLLGGESRRALFDAKGHRCPLKGCFPKNQMVNNMNL
ncbi:hypothetical protein CEXT_279351 [Caerostris extrusa]|uniref:Uncharacterized protein n=1 Tax=Caerostris extrusa TaxID=172846 RepID=A0AAV4Y8L2_CAEEX|nr:hypothetical protein CEXT_279351 [Caerostris extrusa]